MPPLSVQPALGAEPVESAVLSPRRAPEADDRQGASGKQPAARDRVTISQAARDRASALTGKKLDAAELAELDRLRADDQRVRAHERAHQAAGGGAAGAASFRYVMGADGKLYAVAGEVPIRFQAGRTPDETLAAAERMRAAALAPADPSAQDLAVAAEAVRIEQDARAQKLREGKTVTQPRRAGRAAAAYAASGAAATGEPAAAASGSLLAIAA